MPVTDTAQPKKARLLSLDALRGFDMFWIISGEEIFHGFAGVVKDKYHLTQNHIDWQISTNANLSFIERIAVGISNQLHHSPWNGFTFYDLIFPLFIFIAGISMPFSYNKQGTNAQAAKQQILIKLVKRTIILLLLGMVVNGALHFAGYQQTRFASVLGRIALACFFAAIIYLNSSFRWQIVWFAFILLGYWVLMIWVPVPGHGAGVLTPDGNLASYIDQLFLPGKLHRKVYDPEGLLSTIPAIATAMMGIFTGRFLQTDTTSSLKKMLLMFAASILLIGLGLLWNIIFPINKNMWTSSFTIYAGGWSLLLFGIFYGIIDVAGYKTWCQPFVWIGTNSILIYMAAHGLVNFEWSSQFLFGGLISKVPLSWQHALVWIGVLIIQLLLLRFLYRKKIFLKL